MTAHTVVQREVCRCLGPPTVAAALSHVAYCFLSNSSHERKHCSPARRPHLGHANLSLQLLRRGSAGVAVEWHVDERGEAAGSRSTGTGVYTYNRSTAELQEWCCCWLSSWRSPNTTAWQSQKALHHCCRWLGGVAVERQSGLAAASRNRQAS